MLDFIELPIPLITFLVAFGDALFPVNFFIPGEPAFLLAGFELGSGRGWNLVFLVYLGAVLGDQTSYGIGRILGPKTFNRIKGRKRRRFIAHGRLLIQQKGAKFIFASRFLGPVSWVAQAMAGAYRLNYLRYTLASVSSILLALAQFILVGYLSALGYEFFNIYEIWLIVQAFLVENILLSALIIAVIIGFIWWLQSFIRRKFLNRFFATFKNKRSD
ncbi:MAG: hypothetical protein COB24_10585 [Hyphomicrobiales bacterium]|nr:MAG: hypothetical protein COB24_10585 [Hyphomicrobiales bacterium]